jgi:hypothetical protein
MVRSDYFEEAKILVTVDLSKPGWDNLEPAEILSSVDVVLLGLYQITDQVTPEQARDEFEKEAEKRLQTLCKRFKLAGVLVESRLVFCVDLPDAIDRVAEEEDCNAILTWNEKSVFKQIGVFLRGEEESTHLMDSVASMMRDQDQSIALINFIEENNNEKSDTLEQERRTILENDREYLVDRGIEENQVDIIIKKVADVDEAMVETVSDYDAITMGETKPTVATKIFGTRHELVQGETEGPVLIVRREHDE